MLKELLAQHNEIRRLIQAVRDAEPDVAQAQRAQLRAALTAHNAREEELLGTVLPGIDAWSEIRTAHMSDDHRAEHRDLEKLLDDGRSDATAPRDETLALLDDILAHMRDEEALFLNEKVLRDDVITVQAGG